ncbi:hypothetical protein EPA93_05725 [Ktedonosporobacter rubrisoli]|uniref:rRNA methyltransferase n=1 Tax=Ktedonosporobacter rubrisoli TaxID=2509675 RepID=A0A4P6JK52_KTERU|nr:hypothetical protein [Ktedonosporobacter rubrisoli]QBD75528.1 hypothetical protein EPA93_05725 [Ktedonosporobacter rubrisoli]
MPYHFARENQDFSDFATGRVFYSLPGHPAFPPRLASEIFQRCLALRTRQEMSAPCVVYDPCCGSASLLSAIGYLHWSVIRHLIGSDIDAEALKLAERNMALLTLEGLNQRCAELRTRAEQYGRASYEQAINSVQRLRQRLQVMLKTHELSATLFHTDATAGSALCQKLGKQTVDIVLSDLPYGQQSSWRSAEPAPGEVLEPVRQLLTALLPVLATHAIVALVTSKQQKVQHEAYRRLSRFELGKRRVVFLTPMEQ